MGKKNVFATALAVLAVFALAACGSETGSNNPTQGATPGGQSTSGTAAGGYDAICKILTLQEVRTMLKIPNLEYHGDPDGDAGGAETQESRECMFTSDADDSDAFLIGYKVKYDPRGELYERSAEQVKKSTGIYEYRDLSHVGDSAYAVADSNGRIVGIETRWGVWTLTISVYGDLTYQPSINGMVEILQAVMAHLSRDKQ